MRQSADWLTEVPEDWEVVPAKALFFERREPSGPDDVHLTPSQSHGVLPQLEYMRVTGNRVVLNLESPETMKHVEPDDFIIHLRSFQGGIEHSRESGKVSVAYTVLAPRRDADPRFFRWTLKCGGYIQKLRVTTNQLRDGQSIKFGQFASVPLPKPPIDQQATIADYLDRETARLDTLIQKQERLIGRLRERREAVISKLACQGLEPSSPILQAGPEWVGRVPAHWRTGCLRRFSVLLTGKTPVGDPYRIFSPNGGIGWLRPEDLADNCSGSIRLSAEGAAQLRLVPEGTAFLCCIGGTVGKVGVSKDVCTSNQQITAIVSEESGRFLYYLLTAARQAILNLTVGNTLPILNNQRLGSLQIAVPPKPEQLAIVAAIDEEIHKIGKLVQKAEDFVNLTKERRAALITAAVTGQIDVRKEAVRG